MSLDHVRETREPTDEVIGTIETTAKKALGLILDSLTLLVEKIEAGGDEAEKLKTVVRGAQRSIEALTKTSRQIALMNSHGENFALTCYRLIKDLEDDGDDVDSSILAAARALSKFEQLESEAQNQRADQQMERARTFADKMKIHQKLESGTIALTESDKLELYLRLLKETIQNQGTT